jgi:hypothetical protein
MIPEVMTRWVFRGLDDSPVFLVVDVTPSTVAYMDESKPHEEATRRNREDFLMEFVMVP